jgi:GT2 family glycosyltransferase
LKGIYEIEFVNAAAWLISAECIRTVGFFEPLFFLYGEDNNYLQRVTYHGLKIGIAPQSRIYHDRETRAGKMNDTGLKIAERTNSLLRLLNILQSYRTAILFFLKDRGYLLLKKIYEGKLAQTKDEFAEILFLVKNYRKLKRLRAGYKMEAAKRDESKD